MEQEMTTAQTALNTEEYKGAVELDCQVMAAKEQVETALCKFAMYLKRMRDGEQYTTLGYKSFTDYVEIRVDIEIRQVYTYISAYEKLGAEVMQSNARLGITKLSLIASVPDIERADFIEDNDLAGMSVKEIKALIEQSKQQIEQISLLNVTIENQKADLEQVKIEIEDVEEANTDKSSLIDQINEERARLEAELAALKAKPIDVAVAEVSEADIEKIKADAEASVKAQYEALRKQELKDAAEKATIKAQKEMDKKIEQVKADAEKQAVQKIQSALSEAEADKAQMLEQTKKLSKELALTSDSDMVKISVLFGNAKETLIKLLSAIEEINDNEKKKSLLGKIKNWMETSVLPTIESNVEEA